MRRNTTIILAGLSSLLCIQGFVILPKTQPFVTTETTKLAGPLRAATTEKITKEAQELVDVFEKREAEDDSVPHLIVAQIAPSARISVPETFDQEPGSIQTGQIIAALKKLGFDMVLDTNTAADLTILEEGTELLHRLVEKAKRESGESPAASFPLFTSCCPGWMNYVKQSAPELAPYVSTCKSPHMMYGAFLKRYSDALFGESPDKIYFASVMPCIRKRGESDESVFIHDGVRDVDNVITTKDLGVLLRRKGIDPGTLHPQPFDSPFQHMEGTGTGAGQLFGGTGGVMEAAVRTVYELVSGEELPRLELEEVRGLEGVKEAVIPLVGDPHTGEPLPSSIRVAVCNGLGYAKKLIKKIEDGEAEYDFVEVMACPGGCIGGGGQPKGDKDALQRRLECIYSLDRSLPRRKSHDNPVVKKMYEEFLGPVGGETAHTLLHVDPVYGVVPEFEDK